MNHPDEHRQGYVVPSFLIALGAGVLGWAGTLLVLEDWFGADPARVLPRIVACVGGYIFARHVWSLASREIVDLPSLVFFPLKLTLALALAFASRFAFTKFVSFSAGFLVAGLPGGAGSGLELVLGSALALLATRQSEAFVFRSPLTHALRPAVLTAFFFALWRISPTPKWVGDKLHRHAEDVRRGVRRHHDDSPIRSAAEARRRAEELL